MEKKQVRIPLGKRLRGMVLGARRRGLLLDRLAHFSTEKQRKILNKALIHLGRY